MIPPHLIDKDQMLEHNIEVKFSFLMINKKKIAEEVKSIFNKKYNGKITTNISEQKNYCKAEEYHQKYFQKKTRK